MLRLNVVHGWRKGAFARFGLAALIAACGGGDDGQSGTAGPPGEPGPAGPITDPPRILSLAPDAGSSQSTVHIAGQNFAEDPAANEVYFDGDRAEIVSASATELVVRPTASVVDAARLVSVTVITRDQASNAHEWTVVPTGSALPIDVASLQDLRAIEPSPDGRTIYVADARAGLLAVDVATGRTSWIRSIDAVLRRPLALAVHPTTGAVWIADDQSPLRDGSIVRVVSIDPATGELTVRYGADSDYAQTKAMAITASGTLYLLLRVGTSDYLMQPRVNGWTAYIAPSSHDLLDVVAIGEVLYVTSRGLGDLYRLSGGTYARMNLALSGAAAITTDGTSLYVLRRESNGTGQISTVTNLGTAPAVGAGPDMSTFPFWEGANSLARSGDGTLFVGESLWFDPALPRAGRVWKVAPDATRVPLAVGLGEAISAVVSGGELFFAVSNGCSSGNAVGFVAKVTRNRETEIFARGVCPFELRLGRNGKILAADASANALYTIEPNGSVTPLLTDLGNLQALIVGNAAIYVSHYAGGWHLGKADATGEDLNPQWLPTGSQLVNTGVAVGNKLYVVHGSELKSVDAQAGGALTPVGSQAVSFRALELGSGNVVFGYDRSTVYRIVGDVVEPYHVEAPGDPLDFPVAMARATEGELWVIDGWDGQLLRIVP